MVTTVVTSDRTTTVVLNSSDEYYLQQGVLHYLNGPVVNVTSGETDVGIYVFGDIFARTNTAINLNDATNVTVSIGSSGSVIASPSHRPIFSTGDNVRVINQGEIYGSRTEVNGNSSVLNNSGVISGTSSTNSSIAAVQMLGDKARLTNSGTIQSTSQRTIEFTDTASVINSGQILGNGIAIDGSSLSFAERLDVTNTGTISAVGTAIQSGTDTDTIVNSGTINGDIITDASSDRLENSGTINGMIDLGSGLDTLTNSDDITGLVMTGSNNDKVVNSGTITGRVELGLGDDTFKMAGNGFVTEAISGDTGNDTISGGNFDDTILGGNDDDLLRGKNGEDELLGESGNDTLFGGNDNDILTGDGGDDDLRGGAGNDTLEGGGNRDRVNGGADNDLLDGGQGNDTLLGGSGNDTLTGGNGQDALTGGADADVFVFSSLSHSAVGGNRDVVRDFEKGQDKIDIEALSNDAFVFIGSSGFSGNGDAEVRVTTNAFGNSVVRIDANGDGASDSELLVRAVTDLDAGDFIL